MNNTTLKFKNVLYNILDNGDIGNGWKYVEVVDKKGGFSLPKCLYYKGKSMKNLLEYSDYINHLDTGKGFINDFVKDIFRECYPGSTNPICKIKENVMMGGDGSDSGDSDIEFTINPEDNMPTSSGKNPEAQSGDAEVAAASTKEAAAPAEEAAAPAENQPAPTGKNPEAQSGDAEVATEEPAAVAEAGETEAPAAPAAAAEKAAAPAEDAATEEPAAVAEAGETEAPAAPAAAAENAVEEIIEGLDTLTPEDKAGFQKILERINVIGPEILGVEPTP
jgi:hypothetical protein